MAVPSTSLTAFSDAIADLVAKVSPSVAAIQGRRSFYSAGVVWREGVIVSSAHTIRRDEDIGVTLHGGLQASAKLVGKDPGSDLAVLSVETSGGTTPAKNVGGDNVRIGDVGVIVGRSPNSGPNASFGIISAVSGPWRTWRGGQLDQYLRLDAALVPGSSGGAVADQHGRIIGIATNALSRVAGLAVPASTVQRVVDFILKTGSVPTAYLGVGLHPVPIPETLQQKLAVRNREGLMILAVDNGGPAESAGILIGDIVVAVEDVATDDLEAIQANLGPDRIGKRLRVRIIRGGELKDMSLVPGERRAAQ